MGLLEFLEGCLGEGVGESLVEEAAEDLDSDVFLHYGALTCPCE